MATRLRGLVSLSETTREILERSDSDSIITTDASIPFLITYLANQRPLLVVAHSSKRASELARELEEIVDGVMEFPAWETLPHEKLSPNSDTLPPRAHWFSQ